METIEMITSCAKPSVERNGEIALVSELAPWAAAAHLCVMANAATKHMAKGFILLTILCFNLAGLQLLSWAADGPAWRIVVPDGSKAEPRFRGVTNIVFKEVVASRTNHLQTLTVSDRKVVEHILSTIRLAGTQPCYCDHTLEAVFEGSSASVRVSFCVHCFNLKDERGGYYEMPRQFYEQFKKLANEHGWRQTP
jgi:hypothetical protein